MHYCLIYLNKLVTGCIVRHMGLYVLRPVLDRKQQSYQVLFSPTASRVLICEHEVVKVMLYVG